MNKRVWAVCIGLAAVLCVPLFFSEGQSPAVPLPPQSQERTPVSGWTERDGQLFYIRQDGSAVSGWLSQGKNTYYLTESGAATGPCEIDGQLYLFDAEGRLASGTFLLEGVRYAADEEGRPLSGWVTLDAMTYYFNKEGRALTGWQTVDGLPYYFYSDGSPACGITQIDSGTYPFAANGQYIPLVNPWNTVPEDYSVTLESINEAHMTADYALEDLRQMMADCEAAGLEPVVCSSYRTQEYQQQLYDRKVAYYTERDYPLEEAQALAGRSVAVPGTSEHQLGLALDIIDNSNWKLDESQAGTATQKWLMEHSWEYGWILRYPDGKSDITGIIYEPWHYRYVGRRIAAEIHELDVCLEEYLEMLTVG